MKLSDERLDELISVQENHGGDLAAFRWQTAKALRNYRDYRKAVSEYIAAVDAVRGSEEWGAGWDRWRKAADLHKAAEATLRALKERT